MPQSTAEAPQAQGTQQEQPRAGKRARMPRPPAEAKEAAQRSAQAQGEIKQAAEAKQPQEAEPEPKAPKVELVSTPTDIRDALVAVRKAGAPRHWLVDRLVEIDPSTQGKNAIWKAELGGADGKGAVVPAHVPALRKLLDAIKSGELQPPERKAAGAGGSKAPREKRDVLEAKVDAIRQLIPQVKPASLREQFEAIVGTPPAAS